MATWTPQEQGGEGKIASGNPPAPVCMYLTSQLLGDFVTQPVEEKVLLLLIPCLLREFSKKFSCTESSSHLAAMFSNRQNWEPQASVYLSKWAAGNSADHWSLSPATSCKLPFGLFSTSWLRSQGSSELCGRVQASKTGSEETWRSLDVPSNPGACFHMDGIFCPRRCEFLLILWIWILPSWVEGNIFRFPPPYPPPPPPPFPSYSLVSLLPSLFLFLFFSFIPLSFPLWFTTGPHSVPSLPWTCCCRRCILFWLQDGSFFMEFVRSPRTASSAFYPQVS